MIVYVCLIFSFDINSDCIHLKDVLCPDFEPYFASCAQSKKVNYKCKLQKKNSPLRRLSFFNRRLKTISVNTTTLHKKFQKASALAN